MKVSEIIEKDFTEKTKEGKVVIDCYANWCGPCRLLSPIIDELSEELENVKFYKLDVDNAQDLTIKYGIMSIPTLLIFEDGKLKCQTVGLRDKEELKRIIED